MNNVYKVFAFDNATKQYVKVGSSATPNVYSQSKASWDSQPDLIAEKNTIYVYTDYYSKEEEGTIIAVPAIKIGDGQTYLIDLPIAGSVDVTELQATLSEHISNNEMHTSEIEKAEWSNKVSAEVDGEILKFVANEV